MADISGSISKLNTDEVDQNKPVSQSLFSKIGANINELIDRKINADAQVSSSSGAGQTISSSSFTDITNASVTITTNGRPVIIAIIADGSASLPARIFGSDNGDSQIRFLRDSTVVSLQQFRDNANNVASRFFHIDTPSAGTYTYKAQGAAITSSSINIRQIKLIAIEI